MNEHFYLSYAYELAGTSHDPSSQNGAVLVKNFKIIGEGVNEFPLGVQELPERWERPAKYQWVEHAERNAIFDAARLGNCTRGAVMYVPWFACADCARAIVQAGVEEVVGHELETEGAQERWLESIETGLTIFEEGGVTYRWVDDTFNREVRRDGKVLQV